MTTVDVLAIVAHRDDAELLCAGALIAASDRGHATGVLDLAAGEAGTRGSAALRGEEAARASQVMGLTVRETLGLPDAGLVNTPETRAAVARVLRRLTPRVVIAPALRGRHPDHHVAAALVRDACFVAGIAKVAPELPPHRPLKVLHALSYREHDEKPTFVVDITDQFERKLEAIRCYASQFDGLAQAGEVYPNGEPLYDIVRHQAAHYGSLIRTRYGEPYWTSETMRVDDVATLGVATF
ncbi:MAG: bacillithiol biosynthesis deacetylase BshB1 [Gemmatimonadetes bacterium]|nr:bacillithiol biosynthesis deacetylase BshB1 [Gemmatimonadota bacterium]